MFPPNAFDVEVTYLPEVVKEVDIHCHAAPTNVEHDHGLGHPDPVVARFTHLLDIRMLKEPLSTRCGTGKGSSGDIDILERARRRDEQITRRSPVDNQLGRGEELSEVTEETAVVSGQWL
jgi:hypothetical protein